MDLTVIDETGARTEQVNVPDTVATGRIAARLVQVLGLPRTGADGRPILYVFQHEGSGRQIGKEETLAQARVNEHDVLRLVVRPVVPAAPLAPAALSPEPPPPQQQPLPGAWRSSPYMALALAALALAGVGVAVALILSRGTSRTESVESLAHNVVSGAASPSDSPTTASEGEQATGETATTESPEGTGSTDGVLPNVSTEQMATEVQQVLRSWHEDVVQGEYHAAWELLSQRKRDQAEAEPGGYAAWAKNQATLRPYLDPSGIQVSVQDTDQSSGVAQVDVTGMTWDKPGASCREWSGITWVKYEDGEWRYDPGYSTTPQRQHEWSSRYSKLLGGSC